MSHHGTNNYETHCRHTSCCYSFFIQFLRDDMDEVSRGFGAFAYCETNLHMDRFIQDRCLERQPYTTTKIDGTGLVSGSYNISSSRCIFSRL